MRTPRTHDHWFIELLKEKFVKIFFKILLTFLVLLILISVCLFYVDRANNRHAVLFWGMIEYFPEVKNDTPIINPKKVITETQQKEIVKVKPSTLFQPSNFTTNSKANKKDTISKNQLTVTGNKNHMVIGNNSGINGDVMIDTQPPLAPEFYDNLLIIIAQAKEKYNVTANNISLLQAQGGNRKWYKEINDFLTKKGFTVYLGVSMGQIIKGIGVRKGFEDNIELLVGD